MGPKDVTSYRQVAAGKRQADIRLRGGQRLRLVAAPLEPSASRAVPHEGLTATTSGPIAVRVREEDAGFEAIEPRINARCSLPNALATRLLDGQVGAMWIADDRSLLLRIWDYFAKDVRR